MIRAIISGTGSYLPKHVVTNNDLAQRITTSDEWIRQRSGIEERRYAGPEETPSTMGKEASEKALEAAKLKIDDIDLIIFSTQTPEYHFPGTGCLLQRLLTDKPIPALDIRNQCTGFLYALQTGQAYIESGLAKNILIVCSEVHSRGLEFSDNGRHVTVLFGDGAAAVVLSAKETEAGIQHVELYAEGEHAEELIVKSPGSWSDPWVNEETLERGDHYPKMNGRTVFKHAVTRMRQTLKNTLERVQWSPDQIEHFLPHQANLRINEAVAAPFEFDPSIIDTSIKKYGNCASASVPIALDERVRSGQMKTGDKILFCTFAAGFTWGSSAVTWDSER